MKKWILPILVAVLGLAVAATWIRTDAVRENAERVEAILAEEYADIPMLDNESATVYDHVTPTYVLTYAENQIEEYPTTQAGYRFAQLVNIRTRGRIRVRLYTDAELGDEASTIDQLRIGGIDLVRVSLAAITDYNKESVALMMPYIYRDSDHMWAVLDGEIGDRVKEGFAGSGFTALSWFDAGVRNLYFRKAVNCLEDMEGLRVRVQPYRLMEDMISAFGATPVPIEYEDVYSSLEQGSVDGAENSWSSYESMAHKEVAMYYVQDEHMRIPELMLVSDVTASQLGDEDMEIIRECAQEAAGYERYLWARHEESANRAGTIVITLSAEHRAEFEAAVQPLYAQYCAGFEDLIEEIRNTK